MQFLESKIPPPIVAALCALAMWWLAAPLPHAPLGRTVRIAVAVALALLGVGFALAGIKAFRRAQTTVNPMKPDMASVLVTSGVYRITRNPMYVGLALALTGWAVYLVSLPALAVVIVFIIYIDRLQIAPEERALSKLFGAAFDAYRSAVRRWL